MSQPTSTARSSGADQQYPGCPQAQPHPVDSDCRDNAIIDALPGAVLLLDARGIISSANSAARDWLGGVLLGEHWRDVYRREFIQSLHQGDLSTRDKRLLNISTRPLGGVPGQVVLLSDVTESRARQQLQERNTRLASMGEMMARLSHQVRTPIATAVLYLTQLQTGELDIRRRTKFIHRSLARLRHVEHMIRDMLMFAHGAHLQTQVLPVCTITRDLTRQLKPRITASGGRYHLHSDTEVSIRANRVGLVAALLNICNNAIEAVGSELELRIHSFIDEEGLVAIDISDNGPGIPAHLREHVFQPFYTSRSDGTGLGLPVVKSIVEAHDGSIGIADAPGGGARFLLRIPAVNTEVSAAALRAIA